MHTRSTTAQNQCFILCYNHPALHPPPNMVYSEGEAFQKVYVERQRDVEAQWDNSRVPAYDLKEVTLQCVDVDMLRFQGKPAMLNIVLDMQFLHCFGHFKRQKNIPNHSRVLQEPWQVWIPDANVEAFKAVIHKHFKYPKDKTNNRQRRSNNTEPVKPHEKPLADNKSCSSVGAISGRNAL